MAGLETMVNAGFCVEPLTKLGYSYWSEGAQVYHHLFVRFVDQAMSARTHNLHLVEAGGQYLDERLLFWDYLREHPETAKEYARLKHRLAARHCKDREAYTEAKADFVYGVVRRAGNTLWIDAPIEHFRCFHSRTAGKASLLGNLANGRRRQGPPWCTLKIDADLRGGTCDRRE